MTTVEEFKALTQGVCTYCDRPPTQIHRGYLFNGIDRVNPDRGYSPENVVSCCKECNFIKGRQKLSIAEMRAMAQALKKHRESTKSKPVGVCSPPPEALDPHPDHLEARPKKKA